jgi:WD40 repeat protein
MSLDLRQSGREIIASLAYSFYHVASGWCIGIQEVHLASDGTRTGSRLVTTIDSLSSESISHISSASLGVAPNRTSTTALKTGSPTRLSQYSLHHKEPPTSVSYSHPYLITSHRDNTLTMYLVVSSADDLLIKGTRRLWGHTSSVSTVQVSDRGKAVSVSTRGEEIRIWELETLIGSGNAVQRMLRDENSVQVSPERPAVMASLELGSTPQVVRWSRQHLWSSRFDSPRETATEQDWVGFDDQQVVLLRHQEPGAQLLESYDFT